MKAWLENIIYSKKIKKLEGEIQKLQLKLVERQEAINKTNAFWKKKMRGITHKNQN